MLKIDRERYEFKIDDETSFFYVIPPKFDLGLISQKYSSVVDEDDIGKGKLMIEMMGMFIVDWCGVVDGKGNDLPFNTEYLNDLPFEVYTRFTEEVITPAMENITDEEAVKNSENT